MVTGTIGPVSNGVGYDPPIRIDAGVQVTIKNLKVQFNPAPPNPATPGIETSGDTYLENVTVTGACCGNYGVLTHGSLTAKNLTVTGVGSGVNVQGGYASIRDSVFRGCQYGIDVLGSGGSSATVLIERSDLSFNSVVGLRVDGSGGAATARISDSVVTANTLGISAINAGQIITFRTNMLAGNTTDGSTPFSISLK
jgi:hypothetical protein